MTKEEWACKVLAQYGGGAGITSAEPVLARMAPENRARAFAEMPGLKGLLCAVFPYYNGSAPGNLSLYARGRDYHLVARERLGAACEELSREFPAHAFRGYADISPYPEVYACARAGLGVLGRNGLLLTPRWGSYVFCGLIATDMHLEGGSEPHGCIGCGACHRACPGGALRDNGQVEEGRCLSALTQRRGELPPEAQALIQSGGMAWGCDICQAVCPYNRQAEHTFLADFQQGFLFSITEADLEGLSDRAFRRKYQGRAFTWRGIAPLRRNLALLRQGENE